MQLTPSFDILFESKSNNCNIINTWTTVYYVDNLELNFIIIFISSVLLLYNYYYTVIMYIISQKHLNRKLN